MEISKTNQITLINLNFLKYVYVSSDKPYQVQVVVGKGAYHLKTLDEGLIPRTWSIVNLQFY